MSRLPHIKTKDQLCKLIDEIGFLPLFPSAVPGFSVMEITDPEKWWDEDNMAESPWDWRMDISASGKTAYGKFFAGKAGYVSLDWFPALANYRRDGYDFDSLWDEGKAPYRQKLIMDLFPEGEKRISAEIKALAGFGKDGQKGFQGALTALMMETYLTIAGFTRKVNKKGEEYGWHVGRHCTPESWFGYDLIRSQYSVEPRESKMAITAHLLRLFPDAEPGAVEIIIG